MIRQVTGEVLDEICRYSTLDQCLQAFVSATTVLPNFWNPCSRGTQAINTGPTDFGTDADSIFILERPGIPEIFEELGKGAGIFRLTQKVEPTVTSL